MTINPDDIEHRIAALHLVLVETLGHLARKDPEVIEHLTRLFSERADNVTSIRPDSLAYAAVLVSEAGKVAEKHP